MTTVAITGTHPSRLRQLAARAWDVTGGAFREFVWSGLRDGMVRVGDLSPALAAIVVVASALFLLGVAVLVSAGALRSALDLSAASRGTVGRGDLVPGVLVPVTLGALGVASGLILAGALHIARGMRIAALLAYLAFAGAAQAIAFRFDSETGWLGTVATGTMVGVVVLFAVRWRARPRPVIEAFAMVVLATTNLACVYADLVRVDRLSGRSFALDETQVLMFNLSGIAAPLVVRAGLDVIEFGATATGWVMRTLEEKVHRRAILVALSALAIWRIRDLISDVVGDVTLEFLKRHAGALVLVGMISLVWAVVNRLADQAGGEDVRDGGVGDAARSVGLPVAIVFVGFSLFTLALVVGAQFVARFHRSGALSVISGANDFIHTLNGGGWDQRYRYLVDVSFIIGGLVLARRGRRTVALMLVIVGAHDLLYQATDRSNWLHVLLWDQAAVDHVSFLIFAGAGLWWLARGRLTEVRAERLFFLVLFGALVRQANFIGDPFALVLSFAGVGFVVFGLIWGFVTAGAWANRDTAGFPRSSRTFVFLGYSLFSIALLDWFVVAHDVDQAQYFTGLLPDFGVRLLGRPLLYAILATSFVGAIRHRQIDFGDSTEPSDEPEPTDAPGSDVEFEHPHGVLA